jgi:ribosomal protein L37E
MKELYCTECGKKFYGTRKGKCPTCWYKDKKKVLDAEKNKKRKKAWGIFKKVYKHMNTIKPLEPRKRKKHKPEPKKKS